MFNAMLTPPKAQEDYFHAGETFFAMEDFDRAIPLYSEAIIKAKKMVIKKLRQWLEHR